jgi:uncharacterized membrane-anchored protein
MKSKFVYGLAAAALMAVAAPQLAVAAGNVPTAEAQAQAAANARADALEKQLHPQSGLIDLPAAQVRLDLGNRYYFLPADEAKRVLTEAWGNPPNAVDGVLGMVFPTGKTFRDPTWGAVIQYEDTGHVSDKDAAGQDYSSVLADMQSTEAEANKAAQQQGYSGSHLIGWAQAPAYDPRTRTLIWARNIKFDNAEGNTLNYDVRTLGRTGVLSLNMVDSMANLPAVREAAKGLGATVKFNSGSGYADFNPSTDKIADYGLAGLVAAGAGVVVAKKLGLLAVILLFLKKGIVIVLAAAAGGWAWFKRKLGRGKQEEVIGDEPAEALPPAE